jgi:hypothetical protein
MSREQLAAAEYILLKAVVQAMLDTGDIDGAVAYQMAERERIAREYADANLDAAEAIAIFS